METIHDKQNAQLRDNELWLKLRSDIYIRDKGVCWICNEFVELRDYDLGHLIDRCNGGQDDYDNLAVMHHSCNLSKPRQTSLEEAMRWKLTPSYLNRPKPRVLPQPTITMPIPSRQQKYPWWSQVDRHSADDQKAIRELVIEYFSNRPELLVDGDKYNKERILASRQLASTLDITMADIRACLRESGLVKMRPPQVTDGSQYRSVLEHLDELLARYETVRFSFIHDQPKLMGTSHFCMDIMFYLAGMFNKVSKRNYANIDRRVAQLQLPVRYIETPIKSLENQPELLLQNS